MKIARSISARSRLLWNRYQWRFRQLIVYSLIAPLFTFITAVTPALTSPASAVGYELYNSATSNFSATNWDVASTRGQVSTSDSNKLTIVKPVGSDATAARLKTKVDLRRGLDVGFNFKFTSTSGVTPGDGFSFALSNGSTGTLTSCCGGGSLGYWYSFSGGEFAVGYSNYVNTLYLHGSPNYQKTSTSKTFTDGTNYYSRILIDSAEQAWSNRYITVYLGTDSALLTADQTTLLNATNSTYTNTFRYLIRDVMGAAWTDSSNLYYINFTGGTGGAYETADIVDFTARTISSRIAISTTSGTYPSATLTTSGGYGDGTVSYSVVSAGTAVCSISGTTISAQSDGTCTIKATRAAGTTATSEDSAVTTFTFSKRSAFTVKANAKVASYTESFTSTSSVLNLAGTDTATVTGATYTYVGINGTTYASSTTKPTAIGTYSVTPSAATVSFSSGYSAGYSTPILYQSDTLTITTAAVATSSTDYALSLSNNNAGTSPQYLQTANRPIPTGANAFTVEAWLYADGLGSNWRIALSQGGGGLGGFVLGVDSTAKIRVGDSWKSGSYGITSSYLPINQWVHVAVTHSAAETGILYINGIPVETSDTGGYNLGTPTAGTLLSPSTALSPLRVGGQYDQTAGVPYAEYWNGKVDEVKIWSTVRTAAEIQSDMHSYVPSITNNLIAYYTFNRNTGNRYFNEMAQLETSQDLTGTLQAGYTAPTLSTVESITSTTNATIVTFPRTYLTEKGGWTAPTGISQGAYLAVGGGGAGGFGTSNNDYAGGGGGAGGLQQGVTTLVSGDTYAVKIGMGGRTSLTLCANPIGVGKSETTTFGASISAAGGGSGGCYYGSAPWAYAPSSGGSGGGGGAQTAGITFNGANGVTGQGFKGGNGLSNDSSGYYQAGGGGGGAAEAGKNGTLVNSYGVGGAGGAGVQVLLTGTTNYFAGGGGGAIRNQVSAAAQGGNGGGGAGTRTDAVTATSGTANTGGGGGGTSNTAAYAGLGGSGIVVVRYLKSSFSPSADTPMSVTTTAGRTATFSADTSTTSGFTRGYQWQISTDSGANYSNVTGATGSTYTTGTLTTSNSGTRYRVIVTETETVSGLTKSATSGGALLTVNPAIALTVSSDSMTATYGTSMQDTITATANTGTGSISFTMSPTVAGITIDTSTASSRYARINVGTPAAGTYWETVTATDAVLATTLIAIKFVVTTRSISITSNSVTKVFGASDPVLTNFSITSGSLYSADTFTVSASRAPGENVGSYAITPASPSFSSGSSSNYAFTYNTGTLTISQADTPTISVNSITNVTYTGSPAVLSLSNTKTGFASIDTVTSVTYGYYSTTVNDGTTWGAAGSETTTAPTKAGDYVATIYSFTLTQSGGTSNYKSVTKNSATFSILRKATTATLSYPNSNTATFFEGETLTPTFSKNGADGFSYFFNATTSVCTVNNVTGIATLYKAGTCTIRYIVNQGYNYESATAEANIVIARGSRTLSASLASSSAKYGSTVQITATPSVGASDGTLSYSSSTSVNCSVNSSGLVQIISSTGNCIVGASISAGEKYDTATVTGLTIALSKADTLTITMVTPSPITYSPTMVKPTETYTVTGLVAIDVISGMTYTYGPTQPTTAGVFTVTPSAVTITNGSSTNYVNVVYVPGTLTIDKAAQATVKVNSLYENYFLATPGTPFALTRVGGNGTGSDTFTVTNGSSSTCSLSGSSLSATTEGSCLVGVVHGGDINYLSATSDSITVMFLIYKVVYQPPPANPTTGISVAQGNTADTTRTNAVPSIDQTGNWSATLGRDFTLTGSGFTGITVVKFNRNKIAPFTVNDDSHLGISVPADATTGNLVISKPDPSRPGMTLQASVWITLSPGAGGFGPMTPPGAG